MSLFLGCIADDFTGATDLASALTGRGLRVALILGPPPARLSLSGTDAIVVAHKTRSVDPAIAVRASLRTCRWLQQRGAKRIFFKYCSTFDSTPRGNIGPVAAALLAAVGEGFTVACPALPENGRTVENGRLFVHGVPLDQCGMEHHPLNPMTDADLVRVLQAQTSLRVGLLPLKVVRSGARGLRASVAALRREGVGLAIGDAVNDTDLVRLAAGCAELPLITGASGLAQGLASVWRRQGRLARRPSAPRLPRVGGLAAVLAGSCSGMTLRQVETWRQGHRPTLALNVARAVREPRAEVKRVLAWAAPRIALGPVLVHSSDTSARVGKVQARHGREAAGIAVEHVMGLIARGLVRHGVRRLVIAGGETSGAVGRALGVKVLRVGPAIAPGVPWTESAGHPPLALALKSGNYGDEGFFATALALLP